MAEVNVADDEVSLPRAKDSPHDNVSFSYLKVTQSPTTEREESLLSEPKVG